MATSDCWLQNDEVREQLIAYVAEIDKNVSSYYEIHAHAREEHIEGRLIGLMEFQSGERLQAPLARITQERERLGLRPINFSLKVSHITSREGSTGADIGLIADLNLPGEYRYRKAAIIQSKKLYPDKTGRFHETSTYNEIFPEKERVEYGKYTPQWQRMLGITPSSYYFLFNPQEIRINKKIRPVGTIVLSAEYLEGRYNSSPIPSLTAQEAYRYGSNFSRWLIEDFICCKVGDARPEVYNIAIGQNRDFPIAYTIFISITTEDIQPNLFNQPGLS